MSTRERAKTAMAHYDRGHNDRVAAFPPFPPKNGPPPPINGPTKRNIPTEHSFDPGALKPMSKALWAASVALGHALTAYRHFSRLKSTSVSPDGMLGGRGYVMNVRDVRAKLNEAVEALSAISDTLHDEITAPHWKPKLAQLDENDQEDVSRFINESEGIMDNPEADAEEDIEKIEKANDGKPKKDEASQMPEGGSQEESEAQPSKEPPGLEKQASDRSWLFDLPPSKPVPFALIAEVLGVDEDGILAARVAAQHQANSSVNPDELSGPRVDHIGPGEGPGPWGSYNEDEYHPENDAWSADEGGAGRRDDHGEDYDYPGEHENDLSRNAGGWSAMGESAVPDATTEDTPTEAWDFGLGYGARGQGAGNYANPSGEGDGTKGVWGPHSGLPGTPAQSVGDTTPSAEQSAQDRLAEGQLPQDVAGPPARTDYYVGPKDNLVQGERANSQLPNEVQAPVDVEISKAPGAATKHEDTETPYVRYDYTTKNYRPEHEHGRPEEVPWAHDTEVWNG